MILENHPVVRVQWRMDAGRLSAFPCDFRQTFVSAVKKDGSAAVTFHLPPANYEAQTSPLRARQDVRRMWIGIFDMWPHRPEACRNRPDVAHNENAIVCFR